MSDRRQTEPLDPDLFDEEEDHEIVEMERQDDIRRSARDLLPVEQARKWLLGMRETLPTDEPS